MLSSLKTLTLALVVTGMEIPAHDVEDHDDLREEEHEAAFVEEEAAGHSEASVAALEAKIREQVAAIAATHREIEALKAQMATGDLIAGIEFLTGPGNIGANGDKGCLMIHLARSASLGMNSARAIYNGASWFKSEAIQLKLYEGGEWDMIKKMMGSGEGPVGTWQIENPKAGMTDGYWIFAPNAEYGLGGCPDHSHPDFEAISKFSENKLVGGFKNGQKYCLAVEKAKEGGGFEMSPSWTAKSFACFEVKDLGGGVTDKDLAMSQHWTQVVSCLLGNLGECL